MHNNRKTIETRICEMLAQGHSLAAICRRKNLPAPSTIYKWLAESPEFSERYARAREQQADFYADEIIEIADNCPPIHEEIAKAKVRIDTRKWKAARLAPKKYGDRLDVNATAAVKIETRSLADIFGAD
ncbi:hypothetical protein A7Q01_05850 [Eikenella sp. NML96-A-049]|uniref:terminase small subunit-like protein n=1 Tax=unclassified Eikenella TaxID=2639367 RepID=UPI0007E0DA21|nr:MULTISPECIES: hypothetical protein [unclassified Eikenella]OAM34235.1 hypothetical protein A7P97_03190 [Eikenella sp. NML070372]OAM38981.1 hypothetical protein A7Q01_05850 [Eikenella sp. NML96-A-049]